MKYLKELKTVSRLFFLNRKHLGDTGLSQDGGDMLAGALSMVLHWWVLQVIRFWQLYASKLPASTQLLETHQNSGR